jgi:hypothetical protein
MNILKYFLMLAMVAALAACGGGGGSAGSNGGTGNTSGTGGGSTPPSSTSTVTPTVVNLALTDFTATSSNLAAGGETSVSVTARSNGVPASTPVNITFFASCGTINSQGVSLANGVSVSTNGSGVAAATYRAVSSAGQLCSGSNTVIARAVNASDVNIALNVAAPVANSILFISASPSRIFVAGSGAIERSEVSFKIFGSTGVPLQGVPVTLSLVVNPGGVGIGSSGSATDVLVQTDVDGLAKIGVFSGTIPGAVKLRASVASNAALFAETQDLTVASGPPSQRFMSLAVETFNIEGWAVDGVGTKLTARIADRQGNAVNDGTVVNFTTEGGQVAFSCATRIVNNISSCSVDFISQNPRPAGGRVSVLAYLEGTKDYVDINNNNRFDAGIDTLTNIGDAYRDDNENGIFDTGEFSIPRGLSGACAASVAPFPGRPDTCDSNLATTVRQQTVILYSSSSPVLRNLQVTRGGISGLVASADNQLLPMPAGTTISTEASGGTCSVDKQFGSPVVNVSPTNNPNSDLATAFSATFKTCAAGDVAFVTVTSPRGLKTTFGPIVIP